jgi:hypothetical protein
MFIVQATDHNLDFKHSDLEFNLGAVLLNFLRS